jgi:hypothetical protein
VHREDAERAFAALNEYRYDHLILHLEWAKYVGAEKWGGFVFRGFERKL